MAEYSATSQWIKFFTKAGLPSNVAANYAIIFSDNRIQMDMLMDLSKEYLYDMGIKLMGDVIAILRHAKETHNQLAKEKVMGDIPDLASSSTKRVTPASRILDHYTRPINCPNQTLEDSPSKIIRLSPSVIKTKKEKQMVVCTKRKSPEYSPDAKKVRRVLPEEEGSYKIKMPSGTTERSRKILQQQKQLQQGMKRSVFDRLGDSAVSSSTDADINKNTSVFERLGPSKIQMNTEVTTSTLLSDEEERIGPPLQYQGVLKGVGYRRSISDKWLQSNTIVKTVSSASVTSKGTVLQRLGPKPMSSSAVSTTSGVNRILIKKSLAEIKKPYSQSTNRMITNSEGILAIFKNNRLNKTFSGGSSSASRLAIKCRLGKANTYSTSASAVFQRKPVQTNLLKLKAGNIVARAKVAAASRNVRNDGVLSRTVFQRLGQ